MGEGLVLDSFALLALFQDEAAAPRVQSLLERAAANACTLFLTVVTLGEVLYNVEARRGPEAARRALSAIDQLPIAIVEVDRDLAIAAAHVKAATGVGYADCFVIALAERLGAAVVTGDPDFRQVEGQVAIAWLPAAEP